MRIKIISEEIDEDNINFEIFLNGKLAGALSIEKCLNYFWYFEDDMDEDTYDKLFPDDSFIYLRDFHIRYEYRNKGLANKMMQEFIKYLKTQNFSNVAFINACPFGSLDNALSLDLLIKFYEKYGFINIKQYNKNAFMYLNL